MTIGETGSGETNIDETIRLPITKIAVKYSEDEIMGPTTSTWLAALIFVLIIGGISIYFAYRQRG
jgi:hypothetical protein